MIINFNDYLKESLLDKMIGPTEEEIIKSLSSKTPNDRLFLSCKMGYLDGVVSAIDDGADIHHKQGQTIMPASKEGHYDIVKYLLDNADKSDGTFNPDIIKLMSKFSPNTKIKELLKERLPEIIKKKKMITNYNQHIKESLLDKLKGPTEEEILNHLNTLNDSDRIKCIIKNKLDYKLLPNNLVIDNDLGCSNKELTKLPDNLTVNGNLYCSDNQLTTLPDNLIVTGNLDFSNNKLTSLPDNLKVNGFLWCSFNQLTSLPDNLIVNGKLDCSGNQLTTLPDNLIVNGNLYCDHNKTKLKIPSTVKISGDIYNY